VPAATSIILPVHEMFQNYHSLYLYYWFLIGEGTLPHLIAQNTPNKKTEMLN
jgi:hypothetical protein